MKISQLGWSPLDALLVCLPLGLVLKLTGASPAWVFACSCLAIIPLAGWMGRATEHLAAHLGPGAGGLINATFGNAAELIIAVLALKEGLHEVVKASLTGSIIGNILLVLGLSMLVGGIRHRRQKFNQTAAGLGSTLLAISAVGLMVPAIVHAVGGHAVDEDLQRMSLIIAVVLFGTYLLGLLFQLRTHQHLFAADGKHGIEHPWSKRLAAGVLLGATALIALMSELLVGSVEHTAEAWGMTEVFIGVVVVAIIGNAAEHSTAILVAAKDQMDLAVNIAVGSSIQVALLIGPLLVFLSYAFGAPMDLEFTVFEVVAVTLSVGVLGLVAHDGASHWMEGVMLLSAYVILGVAFFYLPG